MAGQTSSKKSVSLKSVNKDHFTLGAHQGNKEYYLKGSRCDSRSESNLYPNNEIGFPEERTLFRRAAAAAAGPEG